MSKKFTSRQQSSQIRLESMRARKILSSKVMDLDLHPVIAAQPAVQDHAAVLDHAVPLHHLVQKSLQRRRQKILILKAGISNRIF